MSLKLRGQDREAVRRHGEEIYPDECCGFLLGTSRGEEKDVVRVLAGKNERRNSARNRYFISPEAYLNAEQEAQRADLDIVGFYHSHPDGKALPSEFDRKHALPWCSYVIVSVRNGKAQDVGSWVLSVDYSRFEREALTE